MKNIMTVNRAVKMLIYISHCKNHLGSVEFSELAYTNPTNYGSQLGGWDDRMGSRFNKINHT